METIVDKTPTQWMIEPLRKYATFGGRARRKEYWWFSLFETLVMMPLLIADAVIFGTEGLARYGLGPLTAIGILGLFLPSLAVLIRRLQDTDRSGYWFLIAFLPYVGGLILLVFCVLRGTDGDNRFGPDPLAGE
jgi:uncharacterized membrane protein YhaH (DUF805 family)